MEKDKSIQNQKVFVKLQSVLNLQREYIRCCESAEESVKSRNGGDPLMAARASALGFAIKTLDLPIEVK